jgi:hypothetical protein
MSSACLANGPLATVAVYKALGESYLAGFVFYIAQCAACRYNARLRFTQPVREGRKHGLVAQSVEQRIENPCVGGSIPPRATNNERLAAMQAFLLQAISLISRDSAGIAGQCGNPTINGSWSGSSVG